MQNTLEEFVKSVKQSNDLFGRIQCDIHSRLHYGYHVSQSPQIREKDLHVSYQVSKNTVPNVFRNRSLPKLDFCDVLYYL